MIVPDASVTVSMLLADVDTDPRASEARKVLDADPVWAVPEHWYAEVFSAVRGLWLGRKIDEAAARDAVASLAEATVIATPSGPALSRMWELRSNLSGYDAGYVAVAESHACTLVTADARIKRSGAARCDIRVID